MSRRLFLLKPEPGTEGMRGRRKRTMAAMMSVKVSTSSWVRATSGAPQLKKISAIPAPTKPNPQIDSNLDVDRTTNTMETSIDMTSSTCQTLRVDTSNLKSRPRQVIMVQPRESNRAPMMMHK